MPNLLLDNVCSIFSWDWDLTVDPETIIQYWGALLVIILHEVSHIMRRLEISSANNVMSATTPSRLLNGKSIKEAGNELEILLFGGIVQSIGDLDSIFLLEHTSWDQSSIQDFHSKFQKEIDKDLSEQPNNEEAFRLRLPGKSDSSGLRQEHADFTDRLVIGNCGTSVWQPHLDLSLTSRRDRSLIINNHTSLHFRFDGSKST